MAKVSAVSSGPLARSLAVAEALTGQLYPAVLIAGSLELALQSPSMAESHAGNR
jgi:hypothetical protein